MDQPQNLTPYQKQASEAMTRMLRLICLVAGVCYGLYSLVLAPLYTQLSSNVVTQDALYTIILSYVLPALDLITYTGVYTAIIYAIWRCGLKASVRLPIIFALLTAGKFVLNFFMTCITDGGFPSWSIFVEEDLPLMGQAFLLEVLQLALVVLAASLVRHSRVKKHAYAQLSLRNPVDERVLSFPMRGFISYKNPIQWMTFWMAIVMLAGRLYSHIVYQLALLVFNGETDGIKIILFDLISDILIAVAMYFVAVLLLSYFDKKDMERLARKSDPSHG